MKKELLITAAQAAYGTNFVTPISKELNVTDRSVRRWIDGTYPPPALEMELIAVLEKRKNEIEAAINSLKGSLKMNTAFTIYDSAFDPNCSEYHEYTADYVLRYAENALDLYISTELAQLIADKAKWASENNSQNEFWHEVEKPLSEIVIE